MMSEVYLIKEHMKDMEIVKADLINDNYCVKCFSPVDSRNFKDDVNFLEYIYYSGLCQRCQDKQ